MKFIKNYENFTEALSFKNKREEIQKKREEIQSKISKIQTDINNSIDISNIITGTIIFFLFIYFLKLFNIYDTTNNIIFFRYMIYYMIR